MENFDKELNIKLPHLVNIDVIFILKSIQILIKKLRQLPTPKPTPEPFIPSTSSTPQQSPSTPQTSSATQSSSKVTEPLVVDPTPCSKP